MASLVPVQTAVQTTVQMLGRTAGRAEGADPAPPKGRGYDEDTTVLLSTHTEQPASSPDVPPASSARVLLVLSSPTKTVRAHVRGLLSRLVAAGVSVRLAAPPAVLGSFADLIDVDALGTVLPFGDATNPVRDLGTSSVLRGTIAQYGIDVVHAHGFRAGVVCAVAVSALRRRPALVTTWYSVALAAGPHRLGIAAGERVAARAADVTLAPSRDVLARATALGARRARLSFLAAPGRPAPTRSRNQLRAELARELGLDQARPWVLAIGRIVPQRNHDLLLAAAARWRSLYPSPEVLVVGVGPPAVVSGIERQIAEEDLPVRLLGARDDIGDLLAAGDVYVLTSRWESPALGVQEAMRAGLPVVATSVGGIPELVGETGVLVDPDDVEALAGEVAALIADPDRAARLAAAARARVVAMPGEDEVATDVLHAYDEALAARRAR